MRLKIDYNATLQLSKLAFIINLIEHCKEKYWRQNPFWRRLLVSIINGTIRANVYIAMTTSGRCSSVWYGTYRERFRNRVAEGAKSGRRGGRTLRRSSARAVHGAVCPGGRRSTAVSPYARTCCRRAAPLLALHKPRCYNATAIRSHLSTVAAFWHNMQLKIITHY